MSKKKNYEAAGDPAPIDDFSRSIQGEVVSFRSPDQGVRDLYEFQELVLRYIRKHGDVEDHRAATHLLGKMGKLTQPCTSDEDQKMRDEHGAAEQAKIDEAAADSDDCLVDLKNDEVVLNKEEEYEER